MGAALSNGYDTPVREILIEKRTVPAVEEISIGIFNIVVQQFVAKSAVRSEDDLKLCINISSSSSYINIWSKLTSVTNRKFLSFCKLVIESLAQIAAPLSKRRQHFLVQDIQKALFKICDQPGCTPYLQTFFEELRKWAEEKIAKLSTGSALNNFLSGAAVIVTSKQTVAKSVAKTASVASTVVDGTLLLLTMTHSYYLYKKKKLSYDELQQIFVERSTATMGSIGGTTTGACIGSLVLPGVGTFFGCVVGGMVGEFLGSKIGGELYDAVNPETVPGSQASHALT